MAFDIQRVKRVVDWLIFERVVDSRRGLAEKIGYTESSVSQILNGKVAISDRFIKNLSKTHIQLNVAWLQTGEGNMLLSDGTNITGVAPVTPVTPVHEEMIAMQRETIAELRAAHKETVAALISNARTHEEIITSQQRIIENLSKKIAEGANSAALREAHG